MKKNLDLVTLVNEDDQVIGEMDKVEAHRGEGKLHRAISVYLFRNSDNGPELLIQQRSDQKIVGAELWANTVCGNVRSIENYQQCAYRRLKEELGITEVQIKPLIKFQYQVQCNEQFSENEIDQVYAEFYDEQVEPNPDEVQNYSWINWADLLNELPHAKPIQFDGLELSIKHPASSIQLAPWFVIMLKRDDLIQAINNFLK